MPRPLTLILVLCLLALLAGGGSPNPALAQAGNPTAAQADLGTAFTYQGRLLDGDAPANGSYDLRFILYTADSGGSQVGVTVIKDNLAVTEGYFTALIDFGAVFNGQELWLEASVRPGDSSGAYTVLSPRQPLSAAPYAAYSLGAPWSGLSGVPAGFADGVDANTTYSAGSGLSLAGGQFSVSFAGSGAAATAARSDHNHLGQIWTGSANALKIDGDFHTVDSPAPLVLTNTTGVGLWVISAASEGVFIRDTGHHGFDVDNAGGDGLHVDSADVNGVWARARNPAGAGGYFENTEAGGVGIYALGGSNGTADVVLGGSSTTNDDGRILSDPDFPGSDILLTSNDAIQLDLDNDNDENGDFWILNGANATVFSINESGDMTATGTKSAAVQTQDYGPRKLYAVESTQNWFEDFGASRLVNGSVRVAIEPVFAQTVNLDEAYYVFLTPLGDCPLYVAEKTSLDFTVKAIGGQACSIAFDYRITAKRLGYEELRLEAAPDLLQESAGEP